MLDELVALAVPPRCAACRAPGGFAAEVLCARCRHTLPWLPRPSCPRCALPLPCGRRCPARDAPYDAAWSAVAYEGVARDAMRALKFAAARPLADLMAAQIAANAPPALLVANAPPTLRGADGSSSSSSSLAAASPRPREEPAAGARTPSAPAPSARAPSARAPSVWAPSARAPSVWAPSARAPSVWAPSAWAPSARTPSTPVIVPVPAHPGRRRSRGFDPAELIARALARRTGLPFASALRRSGASTRQLGASRTQRRERGRVDIRAAARQDAPLLVVLVDDVHTSGATLSACAQKLRDAGSEQIVAVTWARTLDAPVCGGGADGDAGRRSPRSLPHDPSQRGRTASPQHVENDLSQAYHR